MLGRVIVGNRAVAPRGPFSTLAAFERMGSFIVLVLF